MINRHIADNLKSVRQRIGDTCIRCGRNPDSVSLVCVSKTVGADVVQEAIAAGAEIFGENYIQEARDKCRLLMDHPVLWHYIGHLQTNKAKYAVRLFDLIHTVDSLRLAVELDREARKIGKVQSVLIQVNIGQETTKSGIDTASAGSLVSDIGGLPNLLLCGLMIIPPFFDEPERVRPFFRELRNFRDDLISSGIAAEHLAELSMGMTGDFEAAIAEGATLVRIGTAIFGQRS